MNEEAGSEPVLDLSGARLGPAEAAIFETFVVPRYLAVFGELAVEMLAEGEEAQVAHLLCRTGYPDRGVAARLPGAHVYGCDPSPSAVELARAKASTMRDLVADYRVATSIPVPLPSAAFSHALCLHPLLKREDRALLHHELARVLAPHGQAVVAIPMRGSFQEIIDLLREFALKEETPELTQAVEQAAAARPTMEALGAELEEAGFNYVDVELKTFTLDFQSGRAFFEDPVTRLLVLPDLRSTLAVARPDEAFAYVREAIDKYWSEGAFTLTVNVGSVTGRRVAEV